MRKKRQVAEDVTAFDCVAFLRTTFPSPQYAFVEQVGNGVGWANRRWADAVALGLWPSRGLLLHGFEIKVDRADWKRELNDPRKAEEIQAYCDRWWIVVPAGLIDPAELPPTWGLYEISAGRKGKIAVPAPELTPKPLTKTFFAALLRRHVESFDEVLARARIESREAGAIDGHGELAHRLKTAEEGEAALRRHIEEFKKISGVEINGWDHGNIGKAVKLFTSQVHRMSTLKTLQYEKELYEKRLKDLKEDMAALSSVAPPESEPEAAE